VNLKKETVHQGDDNNDNSVQENHFEKLTFAHLGCSPEPAQSTVLCDV
jgi:hypothetical protein